MEKLYIKRGDKIGGPFPLTKIHDAIASGKLTGEELVSACDTGPWTLLSQRIPPMQASSNEQLAQESSFGRLVGISVAALPVIFGVPVIYGCLFTEPNDKAERQRVVAAVDVKTPNEVQPLDGNRGVGVGDSINSDTSDSKVKAQTELSMAETNEPKKEGPRQIPLLGDQPQTALGKLRLGLSVEELRALFPKNNTYLCDPHAPPPESRKDVPDWMLSTPQRPGEEIQDFGSDSELWRRYFGSLLNGEFLMVKNLGKDILLPQQKSLWALGGPEGMSRVSHIHFICHPTFGCVNIEISYELGVQPSAILRVLDEKYGRHEDVKYNTEKVRDVKVKNGQVVIGEERVQLSGNIPTFWEREPEDGVSLSSSMVQPATVTLSWKKAWDAAKSMQKQLERTKAEAADKAQGQSLGL